MDDAPAPAGPLPAPSAWPGCAAAWDLDKLAGAPLFLRLTLRFDPAALPADALAAARAAWTLIARQAREPGLAAVVHSTLRADPAAAETWPAVGDPDETLAQLLAAVDQLDAAIQAADPVPAEAAILLPLDLEDVPAGAPDLLPLGVRLTLSRPGAAPVHDLLAPAVAGGPAALEAWARRTVGLLNGGAGSDGVVKLARRAPDTGAVGDAPELWAVRLRISLARRDPAKARPAMFALAPFAAAPVTCEAEVSVWNAALEESRSLQTAAAVDPDQMLQDALAAIDALPPRAQAALGPARAAAARALSRRLVPVYAAELGPEPAAGDPESAVRAFERALLERLARIDAVLAQVPLEAEAQGALSGLLGELAAGSAPAADVALTTPGLALQPGASQPWLSVLVMAAQPQAQTVLTLDPVWRIGGVEAAAGRLDFIAPEDSAGSPLTIALGELDVPLPLRRSPPAPELAGQAALAAPAAPAPAGAEDPVAAAVRARLRWTYAVTLRRLHPAAQDDLWAQVTFNPAPRQAPSAATDAEGPIALTRALLRFRAGFVSLAPQLHRLEGSDPSAARLAEILAGLIQEVVDALAPPPASLGKAEPQVLTWVLRHAEAAKGALTAFTRAEPAVFPALNGLAPAGKPEPAPPSEAPDGEAGWSKVRYAFEGGVPQELTLTLADLDLAAAQSAVACARTARNLDLGGRVNPALLYRSAEAAFGQAVVPHVAIAETLGPFGGPSLAQPLTSVLAALAGVGVALGRPRSLRISIAYEYPLTEPPSGAEPIRVTVPVSLGVVQAFDGDAAPLAHTLAQTLEDWGSTTELPRQGACIVLALALWIEGPAGPSMPLARLDRVEFELPPGWPGR